MMDKKEFLVLDREGGLGNVNQKISSQDLGFIRSLPDFDLVMFISDVHDHGWPMAKKTLELMRQAFASRDHELTKDESKELWALTNDFILTIIKPEGSA